MKELIYEEEKKEKVIKKFGKYINWKKMTNKKPIQNPSLRAKRRMTSKEK
jgi:hypothetical protein